MKSNTEKYHLIMSTGQSVNLVSLRKCENVKTLCSNANNKLTALARATPYMNVEKKKILMNSFFNAQFFPLPPYMDVTQP